jgi:hypothetical protein
VKPSLSRFRVINLAPTSEIDKHSALDLRRYLRSTRAAPQINGHEEGREENFSSRETFKIYRNEIILDSAEAQNKQSFAFSSRLIGACLTVLLVFSFFPSLISIWSQVSGAGSRLASAHFRISILSACSLLRSRICVSASKALTGEMNAFRCSKTSWNLSLR